MTSEVFSKKSCLLSFAYRLISNFGILTILHYQPKICSSTT